VTARSPTVAPVPLTARTFDAALRSATMPVLVDFWAPWCHACRQLAPRIEELARVWRGRAHVATVNVDDAGRLAERLGVRALPTVLLFVDGEPAAGLSGPASQADLEALLTRYLPVMADTAPGEP
jgi:thioredoxin 1